MCVEFLRGERIRKKYRNTHNIRIILGKESFSFHQFLIEFSVRTAIYLPKSPVQLTQNCEFNRFGIKQWGGMAVNAATGISRKFSSHNAYMQMEFRAAPFSDMDPTYTSACQTPTHKYTTAEEEVRRLTTTATDSLTHSPTHGVTLQTLLGLFYNNYHRHRGGLSRLLTLIIKFHNFNFSWVGCGGTEIQLAFILKSMRWKSFHQEQSGDYWKINRVIISMQTLIAKSNFFR